MLLPLAPFPSSGPLSSSPGTKPALHHSSQVRLLSEHSKKLGFEVEVLDLFRSEGVEGTSLENTHTHTNTLDLVKWKLGLFEAQFFHVWKQVTYNTSTSRRNTTTDGSTCCSVLDALWSQLVQQCPHMHCCHAVLCCLCQNCQFKHAHALIANRSTQVT